MASNNNNDNLFGNDDFFGGDDFGSNNGFNDNTWSDDGFGGDSFDNNLDGFNNQQNNTGGADAFDDAFSGAFDNDTGMDLNQPDNSQYNPNDTTQSGGLKKQSIITLVIGFILTVIVIVVASKLINSTKNNNTQVVINENTQTQQTQQSNQQSNQNVDNIMKTETSNIQQNTQTVITNTKDSNFTWSEITDNENVTFNSDLVDMTFTVTDIQHLARTVDTNNNLVVKTKILGSISGLTGTYELDIPYDKGIRLAIGNSFTVHVQLGSYNDKTVVGEIRY